MRVPVLLALLVACRSDDPVPRAVTVPAPRDAARVADAAPVTYPGVLTAAEVVDIAPRVAGMIRAVHFGVGDKVNEGDVVVEMDPAQLVEEQRAAAAALAAAIAAAKQAAVDVEDARRKLVIETKAVESGISPTQNLEEARLGVKRAEAAAERARSAQAAEAARAQTARDHVANASLRAPFTGTVANRYHDAGNRVDSGGPILRIVGHGKMRLRFAVAPQVVKAIAVGARVSAEIETVAVRVAAIVKQVSPTVDPASGMIIVEAELEDALGELQPGLAARVSLPP